MTADPTVGFENILEDRRSIGICSEVFPTGERRYQAPPLSRATARDLVSVGYLPE